MAAHIRITRGASQINLYRYAIQTCPIWTDSMDHRQHLLGGYMHKMKSAAGEMLQGVKFQESTNKVK